MGGWEYESDSVSQADRDWFYNAVQQDEDDEAENAAAEERRQEAGF